MEIYNIEKTIATWTNTIGKELTVFFDFGEIEYE